jgi:hypothetical protein
MAAVTKTRTYTTGGSLTASNYNDDRDEIIAGVNNINNAQIVGGANIDSTKINGTAVTLGGSETLTNKTITSPIISTPTVTGGTYTKPTINGSIQGSATAADGATVTFDLSAANIQTVTLAGNRTLALSNVSTNQSFIIRLVQDGAGSRTVSWFSTIKWAGGTAPTLTTTASKIDVFGFICTSTGNYDGFIVGQNL